MVSCAQERMNERMYREATWGAVFLPLATADPLSVAASCTCDPQDALTLLTWTVDLPLGCRKGDICLPGVGEGRR